MATTNNTIELQAALDISNSIKNIDKDIDKIKAKIKQLETEAKLDPNTAQVLNKELEKVIKQKISISNIEVDASSAVKSAQKANKQIDAALNKEMSSTTSATKENLAEQEKYYDKLRQAIKEQLAIENQRISAGEKQLEILDAQSKRRDSRISYNEEQIAKKGLTDASKQKEINDLAYFGKEKIDTSFARELDENLSNLSKLKDNWQEQGIYVDEFKTKVENLEKSLNDISVGDIKELNNLKEQIGSLSAEAKELSQIHEIQLLSNGGVENDYSTQIAKIEGNFRSLGFTEDEIQKKTSNITSAFKALKTRVNQPFAESSYQEIISLNDKLQKELIESGNEYSRLQSSAKGFVSVQQRLSKANAIEAWNQKNSAATKEVISANEIYIASLRDLNSQMTKMQFDEISVEFKKAESSMYGLGRLGTSFKEQMSQAAHSLTQWLSVNSAIMFLFSKTKNAISELKGVNTLLMEISKTNDKLSKSDLEKIRNDSFDIASRYGKTATDYLAGVQEAASAGYENAMGIAELSIAAQGAGDMTAELANQYIIATDKAYNLGGSVEKLTEVLDGSNYITNHNAVNMTELAEGMSIVGSQAALLGVEVNEATAVLGTMIATTHQSGSEMAKAFKAILFNLQQVTDEEEGIDAEGLAKYEEACKALNVSLKETKNGITSLRDPMEVLKDLASEYSKLDSNDIRRTNLLSSVGGKDRANALNAILENYDMYEKMLQEYANGTGSMAAEAEKTANSWEGSMNRLSNTWTDTVGNVVNSDAIIAVINSLNDLLSVVNNVTDRLGSLGTIGLGGLGVGITAFVKNFA